MPLLREPLLHFAMIAALIVGLDFARGGASDPDRRIVIDEAVRGRIERVFRDNQGRDPSTDEMERLIAVWAQNEVLYREGLTLGLDQGDDMFRQRLILKMREVLLGNIVVEPPSEADLRAFFEVNRDRYRLPERYDFAQVQVAGDEAAGEGVARATLAALPLADASGGGMEGLPEDLAERIRRYRNRPASLVAQAFGEAFAAGLVADPSPAWRVLRSDAGWHLARVEAVEPAVAPDFDTFRERIREDYQSSRRTELIGNALAQLRDGYEVVRLDQPRASGR